MKKLGYKQVTVVKEAKINQSALSQWLHYKNRGSLSKMESVLTEWVMQKNREIESGVIANAVPSEGVDGGKGGAYGGGGGGIGSVGSGGVSGNMTGTHGQQRALHNSNRAGDKTAPALSHLAHLPRVVMPLSAWGALPSERSLVSIRARARSASVEVNELDVLEQQQKPELLPPPLSLGSFGGILALASPSEPWSPAAPSVEAVVPSVADGGGSGDGDRGGAVQRVKRRRTIGFRPLNSFGSGTGVKMQQQQQQLGEGVRGAEEQEEVIVPLWLDIDMDGVRLRDHFEWQLRAPGGTSPLAPEEFAARLCADLGLPSPRWAHAVAGSMRRQLLAAAQLHEAACRARRASCAHGVVGDGGGDWLHPIVLDLRVGGIMLHDMFEWDCAPSTGALSSSVSSSCSSATAASAKCAAVHVVENDPAKFARSLVSDLALPRAFEPAISFAIHAQVTRFRSAVTLGRLHNIDAAPAPAAAAVAATASDGMATAAEAYQAGGPLLEPGSSAAAAVSSSSSGGGGGGGGGGDNICGAIETEKVEKKAEAGPAKELCVRSLPPLLSHQIIRPVACLAAWGPTVSQLSSHEGRAQRTTHELSMRPGTALPPPLHWTLPITTQPPTPTLSDGVLADASLDESFPKPRTMNSFLTFSNQFRAQLGAHPAHPVQRAAPCAARCLCCILSSGSPSSFLAHLLAVAPKCRCLLPSPATRGKSTPTVSKELGLLWQGLTEEQKKVYQQVAERENGKRLQDWKRKRLEHTVRAWEEDDAKRKELQRGIVSRGASAGGAKRARENFVEVRLCVLCAKGCPCGREVIAFCCVQ